MAQLLVEKQFFPRHTKQDDSGWMALAVRNSILYKRSADGVLGARTAEAQSKHSDSKFFARQTVFSDAPWIRFAVSQSILFAAAARYQLDEFRVPNLKNRWRTDGDWVQETTWVQPVLIVAFDPTLYPGILQLLLSERSRNAFTWNVQRHEWTQQPPLFSQELADQAVRWPAIGQLLRAFRTDKQRQDSRQTQPQDAWIFNSVPTFDPTLWPAINQLLQAFRVARQLQDTRPTQPQDAWIFIAVPSFDASLWPSVEQLLRSERGRGIIRSVMRLLDQPQDGWIGANVPAPPAVTTYMFQIPPGWRRSGSA